jgi:hypothetical protein
VCHPGPGPRSSSSSMTVPMGPSSSQSASTDPGGLTEEMFRTKSSAPKTQVDDDSGA